MKHFGLSIFFTAGMFISCFIYCVTLEKRQSDINKEYDRIKAKSYEVIENQNQEIRLLKQDIKILENIITRSDYVTE